MCSSPLRNASSTAARSGWRRPPAVVEVMLAAASPNTPTQHAGEGHGGLPGVHIDQGLLPRGKQAYPGGRRSACRARRSRGGSPGTRGRAPRRLPRRGAGRPRRPRGSEAVAGDEGVPRGFRAPPDAACRGRPGETRPGPGRRDAPRRPPRRCRSSAKRRAAMANLARREDDVHAAAAYSVLRRRAVQALLRRPVTNRQDDVFTWWSGQCSSDEGGERVHEHARLVAQQGAPAAWTWKMRDLPPPAGDDAAAGVDPALELRKGAGLGREQLVVADQQAPQLLSHACAVHRGKAAALQLLAAPPRVRRPRPALRRRSPGRSHRETGPSRRR